MWMTSGTLFLSPVRLRPQHAEFGRCEKMLFLECLRCGMLGLAWCLSI